MKFDLSKKANQWLVLIILALIWGSSYLFIKKGLRTFDESQLATLRISIAFAVLLPLMIKNLAQLQARKVIPLIIVGVCGNGLPAFLFAKAQQTLSSSVTGTLNSLVPLFALTISYFVFKVKISFINIIGLIIGFLGALALIYTDGKETINFSYLGVFYVVCATICYGISVNVIKESLRDISSEQITAFAFMFIGLPILPFIFFNGAIQKLENPEAWIDLGYISILAVFGTAIAVLLFNKLIKNTSAIFATTVTYLIPIVAVIWGVLDGESFTFLHIVACVIILLGVYLVNLKSIPKLNDFKS